MSATTTTDTAPAGGERSSAGRFAGIDGLRALAALLVFTFHAWWLLTPSGILGIVETGTPLERMANGGLLRFGLLGVALFYVLSGFLIYRPFVAARFAGRPAPALVPYLVRRAARIIPAYWAALVIIGLLEPRLDVFSLHGIKAYFLFGQIYSLPDLAQGFPLPPMWTICVEVTFYIFLPVWAWVAAAVCKRVSRPAAAEFAMLALLFLTGVAWKVVAVATISERSDFQPALVVLPASLDLFAAGMAMASLLTLGKERDWALPRRLADRAWPWWLAAVVFAAAIAASANPFPVMDLGWRETILFQALMKVPFAAALAFPVLLAPEGGGGIRRVLGSRPIAWVGLVSYGLYLWHSWVISELAKRPLFRAPDLALWPLDWALALALSLLVAAASWYLLERHALAAGHRFGKRLEGRSSRAQRD